VSGDYVPKAGLGTNYGESHNVDSNRPSHTTSTGKLLAKNPQFLGISKNSRWKVWAESFLEIKTLSLRRKRL
jgi:hypothetical protein